MKSSLIALLALAGCAPAAAPAPPPPHVPAGRCDAALVQDLVGRAADTTVAEAQRRSGARAVRRFVHGSPVTLDYREDRLNVETDAAGTILRLTCG